ncbi:hypothetical protein J2Z50_003175 [Ensifer mexicanus]|uniref:Uncharacterized protein n=1 Tax=Sinorhizobium mexicanum TaxID=375549 RepID=A0A859QES7_9HYPH|nr:hypothetical protein [Sinorhizobium mexicanum]QLL64533.1 hypothetical protein FKV68_24310 [Sinorhizobium mexicanum]
MKMLLAHSERERRPGRSDGGRTKHTESNWLLVRVVLLDLERYDWGMQSLAPGGDKFADGSASGLCGEPRLFLESERRIKLGNERPQLMNRSTFLFKSFNGGDGRKVLAVRRARNHSDAAALQNGVRDARRQSPQIHPTGQAE